MHISPVDPPTDPPVDSAAARPRAAAERGAHDSDLGEPLDWAIDLAIVGVVTTLALGLVSSLPASTLLVAAALSAMGGAALGWLVPRIFHRHVRRVPVLVLLAAGVGLGACWGVCAGAVAALITGSPMIWAAELLGTAAAIQLGWLWLPTLIGRARGRSPWPVVAVACLLSPVVGWIAVQHITW